MTALADRIAARLARAAIIRAAKPEDSRFQGTAPSTPNYGFTLIDAPPIPFGSGVYGTTLSNAK